MSEFADLAPIDFSSGGSGLGDYFTTMNSADPTMAASSPIFTPASVTNTMSLDQATALSTDFVNEPTLAGFGTTQNPDIGTTPISVPWWNTITNPFVEVGQGLVAGMQPVAAGIAQGLPNVLLTSLAQRMDLKATTVPNDDPKKPSSIVLTPAAAGVPPAGGRCTPCSLRGGHQRPPPHPLRSPCLRG